MMRKILLFCGILSSLVYLTMDIAGGMQWENYSWVAQEFSRLSAVGAPSRPIHLVLSIIYSLLVIAFGLGVLQTADRKRSLRVTGFALIIYAIASWIWPQFFPEDLSQPISALTNTMHIVLTITTVLTWILILVISAFTSGMRLRSYSVSTLLGVIIFGALTGTQAPALAAGQPTPYLGLTERLNIYIFMLWIIVFAISLFRMPAKRAA